MTLENTMDVLERVRIYNVEINSLKDELKKSNGEISKTVKNEIELQTELVMRVRTKINSIKNGSVRAVMRMRYLNNLSFIEIAKKLNVTYQWINKLHTRGVEELSQIL